MISSESKTKIVVAHQKHAKDTGSPEVQIAIMSERIKELTDHVKIHKHDFHSRRGLLQLVGKRKRLLTYLKRTDSAKHAELAKQLGIRV